MKVKIAKEAGFCFGVKRAMKMAWDELELNSDIYALGPLIHNKQAVQRYEDKGLVTVDTINDIPNDKSVIIRSHGVSKKVFDYFHIIPFSMTTPHPPTNAHGDLQKTDLLCF